VSLAEFVEWFRNDLAYAAPETWPGRIQWFLDELPKRYGDAPMTPTTTAAPTAETGA
jgi:hypothetical protein